VYGIIVNQTNYSFFKLIESQHWFPVRQLGGVWCVDTA
jgi:hypothetical protein